MEKGKLVVFIGVAALHVAAVAAFKHWARQSMHRNTNVYAVWIVAPPTTEQPASERTQSKSRVRQAARTLRTPTPTPNEQPQRATAPISLPDWEASGEDAVNAAIARQAREDARRDLYPEPSGELPKPDQPTPLFKTPLYYNGDSQRFDDGEVNTWIGPECYASNRPQGVLSTDSNQVNVVCKGNVGKRKANDKLFDHLRPKYLRDQAAVAP